MNYRTLAAISSVACLFVIPAFASDIPKGAKIIPFSEMDRSKPIPRSSPGSWITAEDNNRFPGQRARGTTDFTLHIDVDGKVIGCEVTSSDAPPEWDIIVCDLLSGRARFVPALDANAQLTPGEFSSKIKWH